MQSTGKILDELLSGKLTKQEAVTKLQRKTTKAIKQYKLERLPQLVQAELTQFIKNVESI
jgi:DNA-binding transcriptional regulator YbjK